MTVPGNASYPARRSRNNASHPIARGVAVRGVVRNMMATQDGNLVLACSGVDRIALVDVQ